jgi:hypothetical protein
MKLKNIERIFQALNDGNVRYLVAGGLAVVAHGHLRFTADIDLILDMEVNNLKRAISVFNALGYRPRPPVALEEFIDTEKRGAWIKKKGLTVFSLWNPDHPATEIDLFMEPPISFEDAYNRSIRYEVAEGVEATIIGLDDLIAIKRQAARETDLDDIEKLKVLRKDNAYE